MDADLRIGRSEQAYLDEQRAVRRAVLPSTVDPACGLTVSVGALRAINGIIAALEATVESLQETVRVVARDTHTTTHTHTGAATMNVLEQFPSKYLKGSDLQGRAVTVTISRVVCEPVGQDRQMKPIVFFVGTDKGMVLNKTNALALSEIARDPDSDAWPGTVVVLVPAMVDYQGRPTLSVRVQAPAKVAARAVMAPVAVVDDIPF